MVADASTERMSRDQRHRKLKHVPQSVLSGRHQRFFAVVLTSFDPPPPLSHAGMATIPCFSLSNSSLCSLPVQADGVRVLEPKKTTARRVGLFRYIPSTRVVIGEVSHGDVHSMHSPHSPHPDRTLCFCPPVPIVLMPNLQMDLVCKVSLIRRFLLRPEAEFMKLQKISLRFLGIISDLRFPCTLFTLQTSFKPLLPGGSKIR
jgi:hypothetical protein